MIFKIILKFSKKIEKFKALFLYLVEIMGISRDDILKLVRERMKLPPTRVEIPTKYGIFNQPLDNLKRFEASGISEEQVEKLLLLDNNEIEISFGYFKKGVVNNKSHYYFVPDLDQDDFAACLLYLRDNWSKGNPKRNLDVVYIFEEVSEKSIIEKNNDRIRVIINLQDTSKEEEEKIKRGEENNKAETVQVESKIRNKSIDDVMGGVRVNASREEPIIKPKNIRGSKSVLDVFDRIGMKELKNGNFYFEETEKEYKFSSIRGRSRYSFARHPLMPEFRADFTYVGQSDDFIDILRENITNPVRLELEIEAINPHTITSESIVKAIDTVFKICPALKDRSQVLKIHNDLFAYTSRDPRFVARYYNKPINLKIPDILKEGNDYHVTCKLDGERRLLFLLGTKAYFLFPPTTFEYLGEFDLKNDMANISPSKVPKSKLVGNTFSKDGSSSSKNGSSKTDHSVNEGSSIKSIVEILQKHDIEIPRNADREKLLELLNNHIVSLKETKKISKLSKEEIERDLNIAKILISEFPEEDSSTSSSTFNDDLTKAYYGVSKITKGLLNITIFDGELYYNSATKKDEYHIFDTIYYNTKDMRPRPFAERKQVFQNVANVLQVPKITLFAKTFYHFGDFYESTRAALTELGQRQQTQFSQTGYNFDGIIFQHSGGYNKVPRKWKDAEHMTLDFLAIQDSKYERDNDMFKLFVQDKKKLVNFNNLQIHIKGGQFNGEYVRGKIIECSFTKKGKSWVPIMTRFRKDRDEPNALKTAIDVWQDILYPIAEQTLLGTDYVVMRKYHNLFKQQLLNAFKQGDTIIDVGSGKGGDKSKWDALKLKRVYACEFNLENIQEMNRRLSKQKSKDGTSVELLIDDAKNPVRFASENALDTIVKRVQKDRIAGMSAFFCMTFMADSEETFNRLVDSVDTLVPIGGKFIGIVMDGDRVKEKIGKEDGPKTIRDGNLSITRKTKPKTIATRDFGNKIEISLQGSATLQGQIEYMFPFNRFEKELKARGFSCQRISLSSNPMYRNLYSGAKMFTDLDIGFIFTKEIPSMQKFKIPKVNELYAINHLQDIYHSSKNGEYAYVGVGLDDMSFIRACLLTRHKMTIDGENVIVKDRFKSDIKKLGEYLGKKSFEGSHISHEQMIDKLSNYLGVNIVVFNDHLDLASVRYSTDKDATWIFILQLELYYFPIIYIKPLGDDDQDIKREFTNSNGIVKRIQNIQPRKTKDSKLVEEDDDFNEKSAQEEIAQFKRREKVREKEETDDQELDEEMDKMTKKALENDDDLDDADFF